jgi:hypothetical protein
MDKMFLFHLGAPEGQDVPSPLRCNGRIISSFSTQVFMKDKMFLLHLGAPEG